MRFNTSAEEGRKTPIKRKSPLGPDFYACPLIVDDKAYDCRLLIGDNEIEFINSPEKELGDPDFSIGGFKVWIYGRQFPESDDYWDGNWLDVIARCTANSSVVQAAGPIRDTD